MQQSDHSGSRLALRQYECYLSHLQPLISNWTLHSGYVSEDCMQGTSKHSTGLTLKSFSESRNEKERHWRDAVMEKIKEEMELGQALTRWLVRGQAFCQLGSDCIRYCQRQITILRKPWDFICSKCLLSWCWKFTESGKEVRFINLCALTMIASISLCSPQGEKGMYLLNNMSCNVWPIREGKHMHIELHYDQDWLSVVPRESLLHVLMFRF